MSAIYYLRLTPKRPFVTVPRERGTSNYLDSVSAMVGGLLSFIHSTIRRNLMISFTAAGAFFAEVKEA